MKPQHPTQPSLLTATLLLLILTLAGCSPTTPDTSHDTNTNTCNPACPATHDCVSGTCVEKTCNPACPTTHNCVAGTCVEKTCNPACPSTHNCVAGACVEKTCNPACPSTHNCVAGACVEKTCLTPCDRSERCVGGVCVTKPCPTCTPDQRCIHHPNEDSYICVAPPPKVEKKKTCPKCTSPQYCLDGKCVPIPENTCRDVTCTNPNSCQDGACVAETSFCDAYTPYQLVDIYRTPSYAIKDTLQGQPLHTPYLSCEAESPQVRSKTFKFTVKDSDSYYLSYSLDLTDPTLRGRIHVTLLKGCSTTTLKSEPMLCAESYEDVYLTPGDYYLSVASSDSAPVIETAEWSLSLLFSLIPDSDRIDFEHSGCPQTTPPRTTFPYFTCDQATGVVRTCNDEGRPGKEVTCPHGCTDQLKKPITEDKFSYCYGLTCADPVVINDSTPLESTFTGMVIPHPEDRYYEYPTPSEGCPIVRDSTLFKVEGLTSGTTLTFSPLGDAPKQLRAQLHPKCEEFCTEVLETNDTTREVTFTVPNDPAPFYIRLELFTATESPAWGDPPPNDPYKLKITKQP